MKLANVFRNSAMIFFLSFLCLCFGTTPNLPRAYLDLDPPGPFNETSRSDVMLVCRLEGGDQSKIEGFEFNVNFDPHSNRSGLKESWFCENNTLPCYTKNKKIIIKDVDRTDRGKYFCRGVTVAGPGSYSHQTALIVYYPPGPATQVHKPNSVVKDQPVTLECRVKYKGRPKNSTFVWKCNDQIVPDVTTAVWPINQVTFESGSFTCYAVNEAGAGTPATTYINVLVKPTVKLFMNLSLPVKEVDGANVTLICQIKAGNPNMLQAVRWYLNRKLLKEISNICDDKTFICDTDPTKLLILNVNRTNHGNYSCRGENEAGWGSPSPATELIVNYPPGSAKIAYKPNKVVKDGAVTLSCSVENAGRPESSIFNWKRGNVTVPDVTAASWSIDSVTFSSESFTCYAVNEAGDGEPATALIDVFAPPTFIEELPPYFGAPVNSRNVSLTCRVECSPYCIIKWLKNDAFIHAQPLLKSMYIFETTEIKTKPGSNVFKSFRSVLKWNMTAWPGGQLDPIHDNAKYTCKPVGSKLQSTTYFSVEYPPCNLTISKEVVTVTEGNIPEKVVCHATANPPATYQWKRETESSRTVMKGDTLLFNRLVSKKDIGNYICEAHNDHGTNTVKVYLDVIYPPYNLTISKRTANVFEGKELEGVVCNANANPEPSYRWKRAIEPSRIIKTGRNLSFDRAITKEDHGDYVCEAYNPYGSTTVQIHINVLYPPCNLTISKGVVTVTEGNTPEKVVCHATANPAATYQWKRETKPSGIAMKGDTLLFNRGVSKEDSGNYICEAYNDHGTNTVKVYLDVVYPPYNLTISNRTVNVFEGKELEGVVCNANANPEPSYRWKREIEPSRIIQTGRTFSFDRAITKEDRGNYVCEAYNPYGNRAIQMHINVLFTPVMNLSMNPSTHVKERVGANITLFCLMETGNPRTLLAVRWYMNGTFMEEVSNCDRNTSTCDVNSGVLLLQNVTDVHNGNYSCTGKNEAGWGFSSPETELFVNSSSDDKSSLYQTMSRMNSHTTIFLVLTIIFAVLAVVVCSVIITACLKKAHSAVNTSGRLRRKKKVRW